MQWGNRTSAIPALPTVPPMDRHGGKIPATPELRLSYDANRFTIIGSGTVQRLPSWPGGIFVKLLIAGSPTFANSSKLLCPASANFTCGTDDVVLAFSFGGGVWSVFPLPASGAITQAGSSGSIAGPYSYSLRNVTHQGTVTGSGFDGFGMLNSDAAGFRVNMAASGAGVGSNAMLAGLFSTAVNTTASIGDMIGLAGTIYTNTVLNQSGVCEAMNAFATIGASGSAGALWGIEVDVGIKTGGSSPQRIGLVIATTNNTASVQGSSHDAAISVNAYSGDAKFGAILDLGSAIGTPMDTGTSVIFSSQTQTVDHFFWGQNLTFSGYIINCQNVTLTGAGGLTLAQGIVGTATNNSASSGFVGEYVNSTIAAGSAVSQTSNSVVNITSISLTAGDWDVWGQITFDISANTSITDLIAGIATTNSTTGTVGAPGRTDVAMAAQVPTTGGNVFRSLQVQPQRISIASTTTIYLNAFATFTVSTLSACGYISARRVR